MVPSELEKSNSTSGEEEDVSLEGSDSESETNKKPPSKISGGESESDADSPPPNSEKADLSIQPLASKPMDDELFRNPKPKNPNSVAGKRKAAEVESESIESKIVKNVGEKKPMFQRLWSEDDEIQLIKGMIDYFEKKGKFPIADVNDFHEFVKNSLNIDVNNAQMSAKIKRLKSKFMNNVGKIELKGKVRSMSNPHEKRMYELSEKLWGNHRSTNKNGVIVCCRTKKVNAKAKTSPSLKKSKSVVYDYKKMELEEKLNNLKELELEHFLKKLELLQEQAEIVLNVMKKSGAS